MRQHLHIIVSLLLSLACFIASCSDRKAQEAMDHAESLMETHPDSALALLSAIDRHSLSNERQHARYSLLMSMALDKNYIDTTTFDVLQPAIDFYLTKGSPDEKLRTYYYQGRIFQNKGDDYNAMTSFIDATEVAGVTDSLLYARLLVAQAALYYKQYKTTNYIENNLQAAMIYHSINKPCLEIKSYANSLDGEIIMGNQSEADSLLDICSELISKCPEGEEFVIPPFISYAIAFDTDAEIKNCLDEFKDHDLSNEIKLNIAKGYSKIGDGKTALSYIEGITLNNTIADSLKYLSLKAYALENMGNFEEALDLYKDYTYLLEEFHYDLFTHDLLFSEEKHKLELSNLIEIQNRNSLVWISLCSIFALLIIIGIIYHLYHRGKTQRYITEQENSRLKLEQENLRQEKKNLELEKKTAELDFEKQALELENLRLEKNQLEEERTNLMELLQEQKELAEPIQNVIKERLNVLDCMLVKEITKNDSYAKQYKEWIESIRKNKNEFMNSTRLAYTASHPAFMNHLLSHGLSENEINYLCLYAMGLNGKEVGEYINLKRHYNISSEIRKKLGIDSHETNLGIYVRRLKDEL